MNRFIVRGFLIGSSIGIFAIFSGIVNTAEGIVFGSTMGLLAGLTCAKIMEKRMENKKKEQHK